MDRLTTSEACRAHVHTHILQSDPNFESSNLNNTRLVVSFENVSNIVIHTGLLRPLNHLSDLRSAARRKDISAIFVATASVVSAITITFAFRTAGWGEDVLPRGTVILV